MNRVSKGDHLTIHGNGGHGLVIAAACEAMGATYEFTDKSDGTEPDGKSPYYIAIGNNKARSLFANRIERTLFRTVVHPDARVTASAIVLSGAYIAPLAAVNSSAVIGTGAIVNTGAIVEHHCAIYPFVHIAPNATLCGAVTVGEGALVGAGATVSPGVHIAPWVTIGCGAVVVEDITEPGVYVGCPAKKGTQ